MTAKYSSEVSMLKPKAKPKQVGRPPKPPALKHAKAAFAERFARARDTGHDIIAQECLEIADRKAEDYMVLADGREQLDREHVQRSKLRIETRLKLLAKWNPKKWGDKLELAGDQQNPLMIQQITRKVVE
jgi:hypothetical protein